MFIEMSNNDFIDVILKKNAPALLNIGSGWEISIKDLAHMIKGIIGFNGEIEFQDNTLNGTPRKLLDSSQINDLGWKPNIDLGRGLVSTYAEYLNYIKND